MPDLGLNAAWMRDRFPAWSKRAADARSECERNTERAPCEHCGAPAEVVLVLPPGCSAPTTDDEAEHLASVESYDWPEESYA